MSTQYELTTNKSVCFVKYSFKIGTFDVQNYGKKEKHNFCGILFLFRRKISPQYVANEDVRLQPWKTRSRSPVRYKSDSLLYKNISAVQASHNNFLTR